MKAMMNKIAALVFGITMATSVVVPVQNVENSIGSPTNGGGTIGMTDSTSNSGGGNNGGGEPTGSGTFG